ncbi:ATP-binding protein [Phenylobacterium sp. SCN 70-31]|uniref:ATP-binding protein n=1 Tax=Phenylobacterium sp. SCN 70-31 TaxID=1660129 RepID=UPI00086A4E41|nr:ATP-binding protein [Phenylobacterium sp. SCN 70-31]ODT89657.1 MAG: hypothetical protein ABS78_02225 [Phenylobacterium sp. SCN 70-31]
MRGPYTLLAAVRRKELPTRLVMAAALAGIGWWLAPSVWPAAWFALVVVTQFADWAVYRDIAREPTVGRKAAWAAATFASTAVYTSLGAYLWLAGGQAGQLFGMLISAGGLLHVTIHMHHVKSLLVAAAVPHALVFFWMPLRGVLAGDVHMWALVAGAAMYVAHLLVAFRQANATTRQLADERNRAEQASKAKSNFLATISHEIRTPMNAIVTAAHLLRGSRLNKAQREQVEILTDANDVLLSLLNDVLDLSKIEAGKMALESADTDLRRTVQGLHRLWRPRAAAKGLELRLEMADDAPAAVSLDALRLKQILSNLISNAVKFTQKGTVTIRLAAETRDDGEVLIFEVADTGAGIPPEAVERLFDAFEQGEAGTTRKHGGSGLGLAISRRLATLMGGGLGVESEPGRGSTFRLVLPLVRSVADAEATPEDAVAGGEDMLRNMEVLVAEDHPVNQRVLELLLAPLGCRLTFCEDGGKAVDLAAGRPFDAILMDMQMPVLDGLEATRRIKAGGGPNAGTPVIALTANALEHHRAAWAEVGVEAFVSKPIDPRQLVASLTQAATDGAVRRAA